MLRGKIIFVFVVWLCGQSQAKLKANCEMKSLDGGDVGESMGRVSFEQENAASNFFLEAFLPGIPDKEKKHGFHIHQGTSCQEPQGHYNPLKENHGYVLDTSRDYHVGDFGNLILNDKDKFFFNISSDIIGLFDDNENKAVGRVLILHSGVDDLGLGNSPDSTKTGNAGKKIGCCKIELIDSGTIWVRANPLGLLVVMTMKSII